MDGLAASSAAFALAAQWRVIRSERAERLRSEAGNWQAVGKCAQEPKSLPLALEAIEDLVICGASDFVPDSLPSWPPEYVQDEFGVSGPSGSSCCRFRHRTCTSVALRPACSGSRGEERRPLSPSPCLGR